MITFALSVIKGSTGTRTSKFVVHVVQIVENAQAKISALNVLWATSQMKQVVVPVEALKTVLNKIPMHLRTAIYVMMALL